MDFKYKLENQNFLRRHILKAKPETKHLNLATQTFIYLFILFCFGNRNGKPLRTNGNFNIGKVKSFFFQANFSFIIAENVYNETLIILI